MIFVRPLIFWEFIKEKGLKKTWNIFCNDPIKNLSFIVYNLNQKEPLAKN